MPRILVELSDEEWELVQRLAEQEFRPSRLQARLMLRRAVEEALVASQDGKAKAGGTGKAVAGGAGTALQPAPLEGGD